MVEGTSAVQVVDPPPANTPLMLMPVQEVKMMVEQVHKLMETCMKEDRHFGIIPGTKKPTLYKPGAELLGMMFRLRPKYTHEIIREGNHITVHSKCILIHVNTGKEYGEGSGVCSTKESKYAYRNAKKKCPKCGAEALSPSKDEWGGGFYCNKKANGCGSSWKHHDDQKKVIEANAETLKAIEDQPSGKVANEDIADLYNTVVKMSDKRANIAATLSATAASDVFTQDLEDMEENRLAGNPTIESFGGKLIQAKRMNKRGTKEFMHFEVTMEGGLILKAAKLDLETKIRQNIGKQIVVEYNGKTKEIVKMVSQSDAVASEGTGDDEPADEEAGSSIEP